MLTTLRRRIQPDVRGEKTGAFFNYTPLSSALIPLKATGSLSAMQGSEAEPPVLKLFPRRWQGRPHAVT